MAMHTLHINGRLFDTKLAEPTEYGAPLAATEIVGHRLGDRKLFRNQDGSFTAVFAPEMHYEVEDGSGVYDDCHLDLRDAQDGSGALCANMGRWYVRLAGQRVLYILRRQRAGIIWQFLNDPVPVGSPPKQFTVLHQGITWTYSLRPSGLKAEATVAAARGNRLYVFPYRLLGEIPGFDVDEHGNLTNGLITLPPPTIKGADGVAYPCGGWQIVGDERAAAFRVIDTSFPAEAYPYTIDPTLEPATQEDTKHVYADSTAYPPAPVGGRGVGTANNVHPKRSLSAGTYTVAVGMVRFNTMSLPASAQITAATLSLFAISKTDANARSINIEAFDANNWPVDATEYSETPSSSGSSTTPTIASISTSAYTDFTVSSPVTNVPVWKQTAFRIHVTGSTPTGVNNVDFGNYNSANPPRLAVTYTINAAVSEVASSWAAAMTSGGSGQAALQPGLSGSARRVTLRFPLASQFPPLCTISKVELRTNVTVAGSASGTWSLHPYAAFGDPEVDTFANQYTNSASATAYVTGSTAYRSTGFQTINLGAQAVTDVQTCLDPKYGWFSLGIKEEADAAAPPTLTTCTLLITYEVPAPDGRPLHEQMVVQMYSAAIPPVITELQLTEFLFTATLRWQGPGAYELAVPYDSLAATRAVDMGHVSLLVDGFPVFTGVQEEFSFARTIETGARGMMLKVGGQQIHRFFGNRVTGPFPVGMNFETTSLAATTSDVESFTSGDASTHGSTFGSASTTAESILRRLLRTHTANANTARKTAWTNNIQFAPDNRQGVSPIEVRTRFKPLLAEAESVCFKADCGYTVLLTSDGYYKWFFLPGQDRSTGAGTWFISADLTKGVDSVNIRRTLVDLVTHAYVLTTPTSGQAKNISVRTQAGKDIYDRREAVIDGNTANTATAVALVGDAYLAEHSFKRKVQVSCQNLLEAGWLTAFNVGDKIVVVDPETGVQEAVRVYEIQIAVGTESMVGAMLDTPSLEPYKIALAKFGYVTQGGRGDGGQLVAVANLLLGPTADKRTFTWKETDPSNLADWAYLPGLTSSPAELNILDGVTSTAAELNNLAGVAAGTATANKVLVLGATKNVDTIDIATNGLKINATTVTATGAELSILSGVTATASNLNNLAGVTAGTVAASKAVVVDASKTIDTVTVTSLVAGSAFRFNANTQTSATAGSASALPGLPAGYFSINLNGTSFLVPYFS